jgi:hypothetical protein
LPQHLCGHRFVADVASASDAYPLLDDERLASPAYTRRVVNVVTFLINVLLFAGISFLVIYWAVRLAIRHERRGERLP